MLLTVPVRDPHQCAAEITVGPGASPLQRFLSRTE